VSSVYNVSNSAMNELGKDGYNATQLEEDIECI
jgi:hypothetical protein